MYCTSYNTCCTSYVCVCFEADAEEPTAVYISSHTHVLHILWYVLHILCMRLLRASRRGANRCIYVESHACVAHPMIRVAHPMYAFASTQAQRSQPLYICRVTRMYCTSYDTCCTSYVCVCFEADAEEPTVVYTSSHTHVLHIL